MNTTIIGSGVAAWTLVRELRKADPSAEIRVITRDNGDFYSKPMLSNALASGKTAETLVMNPAEKLAEQQNAELIAKTHVESIDVGAKVLQTSQGSFSFDQLVLALGADTLSLPIKGDGAKSVLSVNDLTDYAEFRTRLQNIRHVALLGAGLIGCEFANDLLKGGYEVTVYDLADRPLPRLLPSEGSAFMKSALEKAGANFKLGRTIESIQTNDNGYTITDSKGEAVEVGLVLSAVGLRPRTRLAEQAGLTTDRGIVTDALGRTSNKDVYALGDCAQYFGRHVLPYIMPVMQGARALAKTLSGQETPIAFPAMPVTIKTPDCPTVVCPPAEGAEGTWLVEASPEAVKALFKDPSDNLLGMALLGEAVKERQALTSQLPSLD